MNLFRAALSVVALCVVVPVMAATTPETVLVVGDSLSAAHRIPVESGWVSLLERRLRVATPTPPAVINASHDGKTMADAMAELPALLARHRPQAVVLELGGNDAYLGASEAELERDLSHLIDMSRAAGARVAVLGFVLPPKLDHDQCGARLRRAYQTVARTRHIVLLPSLMEGISDTPALLLDDGVHPTAAAQPRVLDNAWTSLRPFLLH